MFNFQRSARSKGDKALVAIQFAKQVAEYINTNHNSFTRILSKALHLVFVAALVAGLALSVAPVPVAHAATITVTTTADELNNDGNCSLREAIQAANTDAAVDACSAGNGADAITLPPGTYTLSIAGEDENANATGDLDIKDELTINGAGATATIIDGNALDRVFNITGAFPVTISAVTIRNGSVTTITNSNGGGGILSHSSLLTLVNSSVVNNTSKGSGGGIFNRGTLELIGSTVSGNSTDGHGGGIYSYVATVTLTNSTVSGNSSSSVFGFGAGGGIHSNGTLTVTSSTISDNIGSGSGLFNSFGTIAIKNTVVANNTPDNCGGGGFTSNGHNLDSGGSCGFTGPGDLANTNPLLGPLQDNGGPTQTHALLAGSPAIDAGSPDCPPPATDQRGVTRPQGAACDIGAFELATLTVIYNFSGFFQPVDNLPALNVVKAGSAIPVKFRLSGDQGLNIFAAGYPKSQTISCDSTAPVDSIEETVTAGSSSLSYNPSTDTYTYVWKTDKAWANTCRQLVVKLNDGTYHQANFKFK